MAGRDAGSCLLGSSFPLSGFKPGHQDSVHDAYGQRESLTRGGEGWLTSLSQSFGVTKAVIGGKQKVCGGKSEGLVS